MKRIIYLLSIICLSAIVSYNIAETWTEEGGSSIANGINVPYVNCTSSMTLPTGTNSIAGGGANTGLDSDKLDGQHGSYYLAASSGGTTEALINKKMDATPNVIVSTSIGTGVINGRHITSDIIFSSNVKNGELLNADMLVPFIGDITGAVKSTNVADGSLLNTDMANPFVGDYAGAIKSTNIADGSILDADLSQPRIKDYIGVIRSSHTVGIMIEGANMIKSTSIADAAITDAKLEQPRIKDYTGVIMSTHIADATILDADLAQPRIKDYPLAVGATHFTTETGAAGMYVAWCSTNNGLTFATPASGSGGGGGNKNREYDYPATSWLVAGYGNAASIKETSYQISGATESIWGIKLPNSAAPNEAYKQINWSRQWANGAINVYATLASTGVCSGNAWLEMCFSTSPFNSGTYEYSGSTTTLPTVAWIDGVVMTTWTITSTTLGDGKFAKIKIRRRNSDTSSQDVYVLDVKCAYVVD